MNGHQFGPFLIIKRWEKREKIRSKFQRTDQTPTTLSKILIPSPSPFPNPSSQPSSHTPPNYHIHKANSTTSPTTSPTTTNHPKHFSNNIQPTPPHPSPPQWATHSPSAQNGANGLDITMQPFSTQSSHWRTQKSHQTSSPNTANQPTISPIPITTPSIHHSSTLLISLHQCIKTFPKMSIITTSQNLSFNTVPSSTTSTHPSKVLHQIHSLPFPQRWYRFHWSTT